MNELLKFLQSASNAVAGNVAGPVDLIGMGLNKIGVPVGNAPIGGTEWMKSKGLIRDVEQGPARVLGETAGLLGPTMLTQFAPQVAGGLLRGAENLAAPRTLNPQTGAIKMFGDITKSRPVPEEINAQIVRGFNKLPESNLYDSAGSVFESPGMGLSIKPLLSGDFFAKYSPPWGQKGKSFWAIGDDLNELILHSNKKLSQIDRGVSSAAQRKESGSLLGILKNEYGDVFDMKNSQRSSSEYITHKPSGTKIRISDHKLPLGYEQADLDISSLLSNAEKADIIKKFLTGN